MTTEIKQYQNSKFYSQQAIGLATFIGGPLAAGYFIRMNYAVLGETGKGNKAFIIGIVSTILMFVAVFSIPESIMENVPNQLLPIVYTGIIYLIVEKIHGDILNQHKENEFEFHSIWKAIGISVVSMLIIVAGIFAYIHFSTDYELYENYDKEFVVFSQNENETNEFYNTLDTKSNFAIVNRIDDYILPKWEENIEIIKRTNAYENLPEDLIMQNKLLMEYSELKVESIVLFRKAVQEDTDKYDIELSDYYDKIEEVLKKLN